MGYFEMRVIRWAALVCLILLLVYGASPYYSFWRFASAIRAGDSAAISSRVDFPAVRASLKKQLVARFAHATSGHNRWINIGPTLIDVMVDAYVTPDGIAALVSNPSALRNLQAPQRFHMPTGKNTDLSKVRYAFFSGPRTFMVDRDGIKLQFRFEGFGWQLNDIELGLGERKR
jgi:DUF2939 family protein